MKNGPTSRFHSPYDTVLAPAPDGMAVAAPLQMSLTTEGPGQVKLDATGILDHKRHLSYRFMSHFHPYADLLVRRLHQGSIAGLQAADTEYLDPQDGALAIQPGSLRARLTESITLADGTKLLEGLILPMPEGTQIVVEEFDGKVASLPGTLVLGPPRGIKLTQGKLPDKIITFGEVVTLAADTTVSPGDGTTATLKKNTRVTLVGCRPRPKMYEETFSKTYDPKDLVQLPYPVEELDFSYGGPYSVYNWELFYHVPIAIAINLSKNQRFEEAQRWFHYAFDPTDGSSGPTPERFWKVKPFQYTDVKMIEDILVNLSSKADPALRQETSNSIGAWKGEPFRPHLVARFRQTAYMFKTVMAYLDNLIAWGDSLFRQDTIESINEATQLYILAANILGPRPQPVPKRGSAEPQTYSRIRKDLDTFGNVLADLESDIPFDLVQHSTETADIDRLSVLRNLGRSLYFCIPRNDKLVGYWDTVADRLFKIRNSLNILGVFRQLALFDPPIDPALLARATAAGVDIGAAVLGINQPLPLVRFQFLIQKAVEICGEVKSLGNNLLSAIEKEDNEALSILRARHESVILGLAESVKYSQWQESIKAREGLEKSLSNAAQRYIYYERLLGTEQSAIKIPELDELDAETLQKMMLKGGEPEMELRDVNVDIAQGAGPISRGKKISSHELQELVLLEKGRTLQIASGAMEILGSGLSLIPQFSGEASPLGVGLGTTFGGAQLGQMVHGIASAYRIVADQYSYEAGKAAKIGGYARREQDWSLQSNLAAGEITQLFKQLRASQIREAIAEREWKNHQQQIRNAEEIERFLTDEKSGKKTNQGFYAWMKREVKGLYGQCFQFAFDIAKKAERAVQYELGNNDLNFIQFGYLAGKEGLLAGEKLYFDLKRMEMAYHDQNQREYEMTKHVSLNQVDPRALLQLRATGHCKVVLPEELFDMDGPGQYFRRIKSVAVSLPCVAGPYTSVNSSLTLLKSSIRKNSSVAEGYARAGSEDSRFSDHFGSLQSIVTSTGQNDSGLFETNLRDERYLPFEGSGVVSEWQLELPGDVRQFDYDTISDVIVHLRYTAREGGSSLRTGAEANLVRCIEEAQAAGSIRLFSIRHEFPGEWAKFKIPVAAGVRAELKLTMREEHYPFWSRGRLNSVRAVELFARSDKASLEVMSLPQPPGSGEEQKDTLTRSEFGNLLSGRLEKLKPLVRPTDTLTLFFGDNRIEDLWIAVAWASESV